MKEAKMKSFSGRMFFAFTVALLLITINVVPSTEAGNHGGDGGHGLGEILASGLIVSLLRGYGRRRRSVDEVNHLLDAY